MIRWWTFILCAAISCAAVAAQSSEPKFLDVNIICSASGTATEDNGSLVFEIANGRSYVGNYVVADSSSGISANLAQHYTGRKLFSLVFNLALRHDSTGMRLAGQWSSWRTQGVSAPSTCKEDKTDTLIASGKPVTSTTTERRVVRWTPEQAQKESGMSAWKEEKIDTPIALGKPVTIKISDLTDGRRVVMQVTASTEGPNLQDRLGGNEITLISTQLLNGKQYSRALSGRKYFADGVLFLNNFNLPQADKSELRMAYSANVWGIPDSITGSTPCHLTFWRSYTMQPSGREQEGVVTPDNYSSQYFRDIVLEPGKEIRLIFPADTPSVRGFNIVDTLILVPR
jgi:hypothetical protein